LQRSSPAAPHRTPHPRVPAPPAGRRALARPRQRAPIVCKRATAEESTVFRGGWAGIPGLVRGRGKDRRLVVGLSRGWAPNVVGVSRLAARLSAHRWPGVIAGPGRDAGPCSELSPEAWRRSHPYRTTSLGTTFKGVRLMTTVQRPPKAVLWLANLLVLLTPI